MSASRSSVNADHQREQQQVIGGTIRVYEWGFWISLALIVIGLIVGFVRGETMPESLGSPDHVFRELFRGHADGFVGVGILAMILTPLIGVTTLAANFFRVRDRRFGLFTFAIVVILIASVAFSYI